MVLRRGPVAAAALCLMAAGACGSPAVTALSSAAASRSTRIVVVSRSIPPGMASPPSMVAARRSRPAAEGGLVPGSRVAADFGGIRVFANAQDGFAVPDLAQKGFGGPGTYPVLTSDGGRSWRTAGPILHIPAAQGALAVGQPGMAGPRILFAWCGACNSVIDTSSDAGRHWWQTFMPGQVLSVVGGASARSGLEAVVEQPTTAPHERGALLWVYFSTDGRRWDYRNHTNATG